MTLSLTSLTYMSHPEKIMPRVYVAKSFWKCSDKWVTRVVGCHRLMFGVNLLCWGTSFLLRNKAKHEEHENWMRNFVFFISLFRFSMCQLRTRESRFTIDFFSCFICFFLICFLICCDKSLRNVSDRTLWCAWEIV